VSPQDVWVPQGAKPRANQQGKGNGALADPAAPAEVLEQPDTDAEVWLPSESGRRLPKAREPARRSQPNGAGSAPATAEPTPREPTPELQEPNRSTAAAAESKVQEAEAELAAQRIRVAELEAVLEKRGAEFKQTLAEREAEYAAALREREAALKEHEAELEAELGRRYAAREAEIASRFDERQVVLEEQLAELEKRLETREAELLDKAKSREAKLVSRIEELQSELADAKLGTSSAPKRSRRRAARNNDGHDLNAMSFEQLRELGLSVTQSARLIAYRDTRGGFDSLDELDEVPGLPKELRRALRDEVTLS
jgi:DNA uptake protein ComE-like DNA-binding protein